MSSKKNKREFKFSQALHWPKSKKGVRENCQSNNMFHEEWTDPNGVCNLLWVVKMSTVNNIKSQRKSWVQVTALLQQDFWNGLLRKISFKLFIKVLNGILLRIKFTLHYFINAEKLWTRKSSYMYNNVECTQWKSSSWKLNILLLPLTDKHNLWTKSKLRYLPLLIMLTPQFPLWKANPS